MALMGDAALAMWWDIAPADRADFENWHTSEHFAERLGVPGFLRGSRWVAVDEGAPRYFVLYELAALAVMDSQAYRDRVNNPTPWSTRTMAGFRGMVRSQCLLRASRGGGIADTMLTQRLSPRPGQAGRLRAWLVDEMLPALAGTPGISGAHLLENAAPAGAAQAQSAEQKLRGGDAAADWVLLASGYDQRTVAGLAGDRLSEAALVAHGAAQGVVAGNYRLGFSMAAADLAPAKNSRREET
jgi:hypothetical protein